MLGQETGYRVYPALKEVDDLAKRRDVAVNIRVGAAEGAGLRYLPALVGRASCVDTTV